MNTGEIWISTKDLFWILYNEKERLFKWTKYIALLALSYALFKPISYHSEATFRDRGKSPSSLDPSMMAVALLTSSSADSEATSLFKSERLSQSVVEKLGLQVSYSPGPKTPWTLFRPFLNLYVAFAHFNRYEEPLFSDREETLQFRDVYCNNCVAKQFTLTFLTDQTFIVEGHEGRCRVPFSLDEMTFTVFSKGALAGQTFKVAIRPLIPTVHSLSKSLRIELDKKDKTLVKLDYANQDRLLSSAVLNTLMQSYHDYIASLGQNLSDAQIAYLKKREKESFSTLETMMQEHAHLISQDLSTMGFSDSEKALEFFARTQESLQAKLLAIELDLRRLKEVLSGDSIDINRITHLQTAPFQEISSKIAELKTKGKMIEEEAVGPFETDQEFTGIDLNLASELYMRYSAQIEEIQSQIKQYAFLALEIGKPLFEVSSLSTILHDPIGSELATKAIALEMAVRDPNNRSSKEQERFKEELTLQKNYLQAHLKQTQELLGLRETLLKSKLHQLQGATLDLINRQIAFFEKQAKELTLSRIHALEQEKALYTQEQRLLGQTMSSFPQKWVSEQLLKQRVQMGQVTAHELAKLVENKNVASNIDIVQSVPIDLAKPSPLPTSPNLILFTCIGAFLGLFGSMAYTIAQVLIHGIPATKENLTLAGQKVLGSLSPYSASLPLSLFWDKDLDTLNETVSELINRGGKRILFTHGACSNYTPKIAELLQARGFKVIYLDLSKDEPSQGLIKHSKYPLLAGLGKSRLILNKLHTIQFEELLKNLESEYDWILVSLNQKPTSPGIPPFSSMFNQFVTNIHDQTLQELSPLFKNNPAPLFILNS